MVDKNIQQFIKQLKTIVPGITIGTPEFDELCSVLSKSYQSQGNKYYFSIDLIQSQLKQYYSSTNEKYRKREREMLINNNAIRKMLIEVDTDKITDEAARKLNKILSLCNMELTEDGWYTGTNDDCKSTFAFISKDINIFSCLTKWIFWNPENNAKEDCIETYKRCLQKWR